MSYCTSCGFKLLAFNCLQIQNHPLFEEIGFLMKNVNVTPAEELMKSDDSKTSLEGVINFLQNKRTQAKESNAEEGEKERETNSPKQWEGKKAGKLRRQRRLEKLKLSIMAIDRGCQLPRC
ncbi:Aaa-atpase [Thalictrum thalictroides]|uniref:Aaa-atpase n=1 Tax=Thalictrum thalictroides TaxID=46969 RepID=A0A7J6X4I9_THATH|nr:Aaa-atpase [Thalictrum thalictroides]